MNYYQILGITLPCLIPTCIHIICSLIYKKYTEVQSPTKYYSNVNRVFYKPLLQEDDDEIEKNINEKKNKKKNENESISININKDNINKDIINNNYVNMNNIKNDITESDIVDNINELSLDSELDIDIENQNIIFTEYKKYKKNTLSDI